MLGQDIVSSLEFITDLSCLYAKFTIPETSLTLSGKSAFPTVGGEYSSMMRPSEWWTSSQKLQAPEQQMCNRKL